MSEYIRVKDGIVPAKVFEFADRLRKELYGEGYDKEIIIKEADAIEELCDMFVVDYGDDHIVSWSFEVLEEHYEFYGKDYLQVKGRYGAIWTDKGLIYVAKMNANGELELI